MLGVISKILHITLLNFIYPYPIHLLQGTTVDHHAVNFMCSLLAPECFWIRSLLRMLSKEAFPPVQSVNRGRGCECKARMLSVMAHSNLFCLARIASEGCCFRISASYSAILNDLNILVLPDPRWIFLRNFFEYF